MNNTLVLLILLKASIALALVARADYQSKIGGSTNVVNITCQLTGNIDVEWHCRSEWIVARIRMSIAEKPLRNSSDSASNENGFSSNSTLASIPTHSHHLKQLIVNDSASQRILHLSEILQSILGASTMPSRGEDSMLQRLHDNTNCSQHNGRPHSFFLSQCHPQISLSFDAKVNERWPCLSSVIVSGCQLISMATQSEISVNTQALHLTEGALTGSVTTTSGDSGGWHAHFLDSFPRLQVLNLSGNALRDIPVHWWKDAKPLEHLTTLDLHKNSLQGIDPGVVRAFPQLQHLDLSHNSMTRLRRHPTNDAVRRRRRRDVLQSSMSAAGDHEPRLHPLPEVPSNSADETPHDMTGIVANFPNLVTFNVSHNVLQEIESMFLSPWIHLHTLVLTSNNLTSNGIGPAAFLNDHDTGSGVLQWLYLDHNPHLAQLDQRWTFNLPVTHLWSDYCGLTVVAKDTAFATALEHMPRVQELHLRGNNIRNLSSKVFSKLEELVELDLSHNKLQRFNGAIVWSQLKNLRRLSLASNRLSSLSLDPESTPSLEHLNVSNNLLRQLSVPLSIGVVDASGNTELEHISYMPVPLPRESPPPVLFLSDHLKQLTCDCIVLTTFIRLQVKGLTTFTCNTSVDTVQRINVGVTTEVHTLLRQLQCPNSSDSSSMSTSMYGGFKLQIWSNANRTKASSLRDGLDGFSVGAQQNIPMRSADERMPLKAHTEQEMDSSATNMLYWVLSEPKVVLHLKCHLQQANGVIQSACPGKSIFRWRQWSDSREESGARWTPGDPVASHELHWSVPLLSRVNHYPSASSIQTRIQSKEHFRCACLEDESDLDAHPSLQSAVLTVHMFQAPVFVSDSEQVSSTVIPSPYTLEAVEGHPVRIKCLATGHPAPTISLLKLDNPPEFPAASQGRLSLLLTDNGGHFLIRPTHRDDHGRYECQAANAAGNATRQVVLNVIYPPIVTAVQNYFLVPEGSTLNVPFKVEGSPSPRLSVLHNGNPLTDTQDGEEIIRVLQERHILLIEKVLRRHAGIFTVSAMNSVADRRIDITLHVKVDGEKHVVTFGTHTNMTLDGMTNNISLQPLPHDERGPRPSNSPSESSEDAPWLQRHYVSVLLLAIVLCVVATSLLWVFVLCVVTRCNHLAASTKRPHPHHESAGLVASTEFIMPGNGSSPVGELLSPGDSLMLENGTARMLPTTRENDFPIFWRSPAANCAMSQPPKKQATSPLLVFSPNPSLVDRTFEGRNDYDLMTFSSTRSGSDVVT